MTGSVFTQPSKSDEYYTTPETVELIVPFLKARKYDRILCPFDTPESKFRDVLAKNGFSVTVSHIDTGTDFFTISDEELRQYSAIVSNPPFSRKTEVLEKLFAAAVPFAMVLPISGLFDGKRFDLFNKNKFELLIPRGRIRYFTADGKYTNPYFQSGFCCHDILPQQIIFADDYKRAKGGPIYDR